MNEPLPDERPIPKTSWLRYVPGTFVGLAIYYYTYSFLTLPFVDKLWFGELPPLAIAQLPKSMLNQRIQDYLISWLPALGLASGSPSPDMILTAPWALGLTVTLPALVILAIAIATLPRGAYRWALIAVLLTVAVLDGAVTFWYDTVKSFSIF